MKRTHTRERYAAHLYSSHALYDKNSRQQLRKAENNNMIITRKNHLDAREIEKLSFECVIILILKIHYFLLLSKKTPKKKLNLIPVLILNEFSRVFGSENLIWNKSRNTFFMADNSNALLTFIFVSSHLLAFFFMGLLVNDVLRE